jgi:hypothetical protein
MTRQRTSFKGSLAVPGWESTAGEKHRRAKLTDDQIREIRRAIEKPEALAIKYGVSAGHIIKIKRRQARKDVRGKD